MSNKQGVTSFKKLSMAMLIGCTTLFLGFMTSVLQLSLKMVSIDPTGYTKSFALATSVGAFVSLFANPLGGFLSDRTKLSFGKRKTWILIGTTLGALTILLTGFVKSIGSVVILYMVMQLVFNFAIASYTALIPDQTPKDKRATLSGINGSSLVLGVFIGQLLVHFIWNSSEALFYTILAASTLAGGIISVMMLNDSPAEDVITSDNKTKTPIYPSIKEYPNFTRAMLVKFFFMIGTGGTSYINIMLINKMHVTSAYVASVFSLVVLVATAGSAVSSYVGGYLSDKYKKQKAFMYVAAVIAFIGSLMYAFALSPVLVMGALVVTTVAGGVFSSVDSAMVTRVIPKDGHNGKYFGLMNVANSLPQTLVPAFAPILLSMGNKLNVNEWTFFYLVLAFGLVISLLFLKPIPDSYETE